MASVIFPTVLNGVAISFIFVPLTTATMSQLRQRQIGSATGLYNLMLNIGGSVGIALVTTLVARGSQAHQALMVGHLTPTDPAFTRQLHATSAMLARHSDPATAAHQAYAIIYNILNQQAHLWAFVDTFRVFGLMVLCCIPLIFLFKRTKQPAIQVVEVQ
jgi:DHA2 family multidrug resistance protein